MTTLVQAVRATPRFPRGGSGRTSSSDYRPATAWHWSSSRTEKRRSNAPCRFARSSRAIPRFLLRMGIHSGPVKTIRDVNDRANLAGAGIDLAQRVMDCGDAGHILFSKRVADDLAPHPRWNRYLHDLGECEVKHGRKVSLFNFYSDSCGNPEATAKARVRSAGSRGHGEDYGSRGPRDRDLRDRRIFLSSPRSSTNKIRSSSCLLPTSARRRIRNISAKGSPSR